MNPPRCPNCRRADMVLVGPARREDWGDAVPVDAEEHEVWRCERVNMKGEREVCCEVKRKPDGTATRDPRWAKAPAK